MTNFFLIVAVPILPDYLTQLDEASAQNNLDNLQENLIYKNLYLHYVSHMFGKQSSLKPFNETLPKKYFEFDVVHDKLWNNNKLNEENSAVGFLLAIKALVQLIATPFVTNLINSFGYRIPAVFGTFGLFTASISILLETKSTLMIFNRIFYYFSVCFRKKLLSIVSCKSNSRCSFSLYQCMWNEYSGTSMNTSN